MRAGPAGRPEKAMYSAEPALEGEGQCRGSNGWGRGDSAECADRAENKRRKDQIQQTMHRDLMQVFTPGVKVCAEAARGPHVVELTRSTARHGYGPLRFTYPPAAWPRPSSAAGPRLRWKHSPGRPAPGPARPSPAWCWPRARQYPTCGLTDTARGPGSREDWHPADLIRTGPSTGPAWPVARAANLTRVRVRCRARPADRAPGPPRLGH